MSDREPAHYVALCQIHNPTAAIPPDSGRPPAETAPGGRPGTTTEPGPADLQVPDPQFPTKTPAGRRSSPTPLPAPGGQPDPSPRTRDFSVGPLRWARCDDGRLHLLAPVEVVVAATGGHAEALCGRPLSVAGLTLTPVANGSSRALCMTCVSGIPSDPGPGHPVPGLPLTSADAAARALQECFLANADRDDNAANDELVAEMMRRMRALRASREGGC